MSPPRAIELPARLKAPAGLLPAGTLKVMPLKIVPAAILLVFAKRIVPLKKSESPVAGGVPPSQLPPVCHLPSEPPPVQVSVAPRTGNTATMQSRDTKIEMERSVFVSMEWRVVFIEDFSLI